MNAAVQNMVVMPRREVISLAAADDVFYCRHFFPKDFRQRTPDWHRDYWSHFNAIDRDLFAAEIFRGGAKTTLARAGISKRIAYAISRNMLSIAISETQAEHTVRWIKYQIEQRGLWAETFQLYKGAKWTDNWIEIYNAPLDVKINLMAKGMTSGIRGVNLDGWRPDFILCDDISNEETIGTEEQRTKNSELFFGTIVPALAPKSEAPMRKLVLNQTGLHKEDIVYKAHEDTSFYTVKYPKLIYDAQGSPQSAWPERFSLAEVLEERDQYIRRNQLHIWNREYGCKITSRETNPLDASWLKQYRALPTNLLYYVGLDPATSKKTNAHRTAGMLIGWDPRNCHVYIVDYFSQTGKNPKEMWVWLVRMWRTYRPRKIGVETVAFQKFLAWYFKEQMKEDRTFFVIEEVNDKRSKPDRIIQAYSGVGSEGRLWVSPNHTEFIQGFTDWIEGQDWDLGDAGAQAVTLCLGLAPSFMDNEDFAYVEEEEKDIPDLEFEEGAP